MFSFTSALLKYLRFSFNEKLQFFSLGSRKWPKRVGSKINTVKAKRKISALARFGKSLSILFLSLAWGLNFFLKLSAQKFLLLLKKLFFFDFDKWCRWWYFCSAIGFYFSVLLIWARIFMRTFLSISILKVAIKHMGPRFFSCFFFCFDNRRQVAKNRKSS